MNKLAVGFATFLLVGVITLFAVPLLVDWQRYETSISHFVSQRIGLKTEIAGEIGLKFLPHPTFVFKKVVFKDPASGRVISDTSKIEGRPQLWNLLKGELSLEHVKLTGSSIDLTGQNTSVEQLLLNWIQDSEARSDESSIIWNRLELEDSKLVWAPFNQASRRVEEIQLVWNEGEASSQHEVSADFSINGVEHNFDLTVGAAKTSGSKRSLVSRQLDLELVDKLNDQGIDFSGAVLLDRLNSVVLNSLVFEGTASGKGALELLGLSDLYPELTSLSNSITYSTDLKVDRTGASFRNIKLKLENADFNGEAYLSYGGRSVIEASFQSDRFELGKGENTENVGLLRGWLVDVKALLARNYWTDVRLNLAVEKMFLGGPQLGRVNASLNYLDGLVLDSELTVDLIGRHELHIGNLTYEPGSNYLAATWTAASLNLAKAIRPFSKLLSELLPVGQIADLKADGKLQLKNDDLLIEVAQGNFDSSQFSGFFRKDLSKDGGLSTFLEFDRLDLDNYLSSNLGAEETSTEGVSVRLIGLLTGLTKIPESQLDFSILDAVWLGKRMKAPRFLLSSPLKGIADASFISDNVSGVEISASVSSTASKSGAIELSKIALSLREKTTSGELVSLVEPLLTSLALPTTVFRNRPTTFGLNANKNAQAWRFDAESLGEVGNWSLTSTVDGLFPLIGIDGEWRLEKMIMSHFLPQLDLEDEGLKDSFQGSGKIVSNEENNLLIAGDIQFSDGVLAFDGQLRLDEQSLDRFGFDYGLHSGEKSPQSRLMKLLKSEQSSEVFIVGSTEGRWNDNWELTFDSGSHIGESDFSGELKLGHRSDEQLYPIYAVKLDVSQFETNDLPTLQSALRQGVKGVGKPKIDYALSVGRLTSENSTIHNLEVFGTVENSKVTGDLTKGEWLGGKLDGDFSFDLSQSPHWDVTLRSEQVSFNNELGPLELLGQGEFHLELGGRGLLPEEFLSTLSGRLSFKAVPALFVESPETVVSWLDKEAQVSMSESEAALISELMAESFANAVADVEGKLTVSGSKVRLRDFSLQQAGFSLQASGSHDLLTKDVDFSASVLTLKDEQIPEFSLQGSGVWPKLKFNFFGKRLLED